MATPIRNDTSQPEVAPDVLAPAHTAQTTNQPRMAQSDAEFFAELRRGALFGDIIDRVWGHGDSPRTVEDRARYRVGAFTDNDFFVSDWLQDPEVLDSISPNISRPGDPRLSSTDTHPRGETTGGPGPSTPVHHRPSSTDTHPRGEATGGFRSPSNARVPRLLSTEILNRGGITGDMGLTMFR